MRPARRVRANPRRRAGARASAANSPEDQCALDYARSLVNPFDYDLNPCIPKFPTLPTRKVCTFVSGQGSTGANGNGGVSCYMNASNSGVSLGVSFNASYNGSGIPAFNDTGAVAVDQNSPFAAADFGPSGVQCRLVSAGLKVRFIGTRLNAGGLAFPILEPDLQNVVGMTTDVITQYDKYKEGQPYSDGWVSVVYTPRKPVNFEFSDTYLPICAPGEAPMGILVRSAGGAQPFEYVWTAHWEFIGKVVRGKTASHASPLTDRILSGTVALPAATESAIQNTPDTESTSVSVGRQLINYGSDALLHLGKGAIQIGAQRAASAMMTLAL